MNLAPRLIVALLLAGSASAVHGAAPATPTPVDFVRDVRPILQKHCYECHGAEKQKSALRLDIKSEALRGGDAYGPNLIAKKSAESPLIQLITSKDPDERMPPDAEPLSAAEIALLTRWIDEGAVWPDGVDLAKLVDRRDHWSFKPPADPQPPAVKNTAWPRGEIDRFVLARLEREGLQPAPDASRAAWLRRVTFDLIGLPPTPAELDDFVIDKSADAHERVVERLLASPRYGERWAQHWLDVVRYADTHGFEVNTERPNAWPYRDYVIEAFNADVPYDRFIREQLAGDAFGRDAATGFLVTASVLLKGQIGADEPSKRLARQDSLDEIVTNVGQTFLGLSIGCARCHDHKFDPISARDYYAMQAFVAGVEYEDRELRTPDAEANRKLEKEYQTELAEIERKLTKFVPLAKSGAERAMVSARQNVERFAPTKAKRIRLTILATNNLEPCVDELEAFDTAGRNVALASLGTKAASSGDSVSADRHELRFVNDGVYGNSRSWMSNEKGRGWVELEFAEPQVIERVVWGRDREGRFNDRLATSYTLELVEENGKRIIVADGTDRKPYKAGDNKPVVFSVKGLDAKEAAEAEPLDVRRKELVAKLAGVKGAQKAFAGVFREPDVIRLLNRGDPEQPKDVVPPCVPALFAGAPLDAKATELQRRLALAEWIASPTNPLTARVMVNRIWQGHFGIGLVETASDFGRTGTAPSHPELLDRLAHLFVRNGWSVKRMHRLIVLSAAYRQSSRYDAAAAARDADVRLLWRFPSRRLEAEAIRDSMLFVAGRLNLKMGGSGYNLFDKRGGLSGFTPIESFSGDGLRRMIYAHKVRREREAVFGAFDCPDAGQSTARRRESSTPIQALNLFNSKFTLEQAAAFAERVKTEASGPANPETTRRQVAQAYRLALGREPNAAELDDAAGVVSEHGLAALCRVLFNSNEFLFLP
jgi:mono/diheme cytochrome c family protein